MSKRKLHLVHAAGQALLPDPRDLSGPMKRWLSTVDTKDASAKYSLLFETRSLYVALATWKLTEIPLSLLPAF